MAQEKSRYKPREKARKKPSEASDRIPVAEAPPQNPLEALEEKSEEKPYRYGKEQAKAPVLLIGILLILILVIGGGLLISLGQMQGHEEPPTPLPNKTNQTNVTTNMTNVTLCDDQCIYARAVSTQNLSDCQLISGGGLQQDCYYQLSQMFIDACKALTDDSRKKPCITSFAVAQKDITLCDLITAGRDECRLAVDPCINAEDRALCLAILDNNAALCGSNSICLLNYSLTWRNATACGLITEATVSKACYSAIKLTDKCAELPALAERDYCYQLYATYSNDYTVCTQISAGSDYAVDCYSYFAAMRDDLSICDIFSLNERWDCYTHYALATGDLDGCRSVDPLATTHRFNCVFEYAKQYGNVAACDVIEQMSSRDTCYQGTTIYSNQNLNWTYCKDVLNFDWRNKCFTEAAKLYDNVSLCDYTQDGYADEACRIAYEANKTG
ncbi:hypothetical protein H0O00_05205 [Candidatus Micrarchaeota archaeon]|nr:hypothetical protein [Candidatus Micrarchaeota archaeon]